MLRTGVGVVACAPIVVYYWIATRPRRPPSLEKLAAKAGFQKRHEAVAEWADGQLRLIEAGARRLVRAGVSIEDACLAGQVTRGWVTLHRDPYRVVCNREVCAIYGADGDLVTSVQELAAVLYSAGWGYYSDPDPQAQMSATLTAAGVASPDWRPRDDVPRPPGYPDPGNPDAVWASPSMLIRAERGHPPAAGPSLRDVPRHEARAPTPFYHPVEVSGEDVSGLASQALDEHDHAFLIQISISYLSSPRVPLWCFAVM